MVTKTMSVPRQLWFDGGELELEFPDSWDVVPCRMNGHGAARIKDEDIQGVLRTPVGTAPLRELARGKREVAIVFDDLSRPTKAGGLVPHVIGELHAAGVADEAIRFVCATGSHGAHTYEDFKRKLGAGTLDRFAVYNHNP
ncbi:MAG: lactate racemase domain-containing protein, partial [Chloroflexota bacterium]|nr:lactate racemase domain-containing protein [Chloroflexota bacterium]